MVQCSVFRVWGTALVFGGLGFRIWGLGLSIEDLGLRVGKILGLRVSCVGFGAAGYCFRVEV